MVGSQTNSVDENIPRGCLKLNNKIYPVYEGLNTVGRNPEATINIKNLNISQHHAVITIVDANNHFISDFKSSNGTAVDTKKLKPLKLYKLLNGASVKFADVYCTYKKLDNDEHVLDTLEETQNFDETLYGASTQAIHLGNSDEPTINEMPTQVIRPGLGLHEMPTQVMPCNSLSINEMPTQVFSYNDSIIKSMDDVQDNSSSDSLDFVTMQKATQSQGFALNQSDSDTDEEAAIAPVKLNKKNLITSDSEGVQSTPEILPVELNSNKSTLTTDSETTQSTSETKTNVTDPEQENESETCSPICPVRTSIKNPIESDSDSDTEEYIPRPERRKSKYIISDDDETDIEDAGMAETTLNDTDIIPNTQENPQKTVTCRTSHNLEQSSMDSFRLELSERRDESSGETEEKELSSIPQDHVYCQEASNELTTSSDENNQDLAEVNVQKRNSVAEDHIYCRSLEASQENEEDPIKVVKNGQDVGKLSGEERLSEGGEGPSHTAEWTSNDKNLEETKKTDEKGTGEGSHLQNVEKAVEEDAFDQATQELGLDFVKDDTLSVIDNKETDGDSQLTDRKLEVETSEDGALKNDVNALETSKELPVDIFEQRTERQAPDGDDETQSVVDDKEVDRNSDTELIPTEQKDEEKDNLNHAIESKNEEDDIFVQPTQQVDLGFVADEDKVKDEIYLQSTQKISISEPDKGIFEDDDIYVQPTQQINQDVGLASKSDDFYLLPTQPLKDDVPEDKHKDEMNSSVVKDHEFALPFAPVGKKSVLKGIEDDEDCLPLPFAPVGKKSVLKSIEDDDEDCLPPTQALENLHKEDEATESKKPDSDAKKVEDELEMLFYSQSDHRFVATQQLVDVLEDKNDDDIIEASMIEDPSTSKIAKFSIDSIRMILDEDLEADKDKNVEPLEEDKGDRAETKSSDNSENERTGRKKESIKNSTRLEEKEDRSKQVRREKAEELEEQTVEKQSESGAKGRTTRAKTRSKKSHDEDISDDVSCHKVETPANSEEVNVNRRDVRKGELVTREKTEELEKQAQAGKGRIREETSNKKNDGKESDISEDVSSDKNANLAAKRTKKEKTDELKQQTQEKNDEKQVATRKTRNRKNDKATDIPEDTSRDKVETPASLQEKDVNQTDDVKDKRTRKGKVEELKENNSNQIDKEVTEKAAGSGGKGRTTRQGTRAKKGGQREEESNDEAEGQVNTKKENATTLKENNVGQPNEIEVKSGGKGRTTRKATRGVKDDDKISEISEGTSRANTPVDAEKIEELTRSKRTTKGKAAQVKEDEQNKKREPEADDTIVPIRSSKRVRKDNDKDSESSEAKSTDSVPDEKESNRKNRGRRKNIESHEGSNETESNPPETEIQQAGGSVTRKRNLKSTDVDSDDEFVPKVQKVGTPKKTPVKQKGKNVETMARPETPTPRKSTRTRKLKLDEDEVISVASSSSVPDEVISIASSASGEPVKKSRRLSANSRAQRNEEEKIKQKAVKGRKASIQGSPPVPATPERNRRQLKPKVVFTMMDNPELESLIRQLGGSVVDTVDAATVLVTVSVKRSQKLLCAVGQGKPICSPQWLHACRKSFSFLDPWDYILVDTEAEKKWDFSLRESLNRSTKTKLLENYTFQLIVNTAADVLKGAIEACGGKCVTRNLVKADTDNKVIVSSSDNKNKYSKIVKQDPSIKVVEAEAIFDGTLRQELRLDKYLLT